MFSLDVIARSALVIISDVDKAGLFKLLQKAAAFGCITRRDHVCGRVLLVAPFNGAFKL